MAWKHIASFRLIPPPSFSVSGVVSSTASAGTIPGAAPSSHGTAVDHSSPSSSLWASRLRLAIVQGSVVDFCPTTATSSTTVSTTRPPQCRAAIVNAANPECLGGGGVDGAIAEAGGPNLARDRQALPVILRQRNNKEIRCPTGQAKMTGPGDYGTLHVPYVIHAVGPNYWSYQDDGGKELGYSSVELDTTMSEVYEQGHELLRSSYQASLDCAHQHHLQEVAFSLLSAGVYRGQVPLSLVLKIGVEAIRDWVLLHHQQQQQQQQQQAVISLEHIYLCCFTLKEARALVEVCDELQLMWDDDY